MPSRHVIRTSLPSKSALAAWAPHWLPGFIRPSVSSFREVCRPDWANTKLAIGVVTLGGLVTAIASHLAGALQPGARDLGWLAGSPAIARFALAMVAFLISFVVEIAVIQFIAWSLGGRGSFTQLSFLIAVYAVPIDVLSSVFSSAYVSSPMALPFLCLLPMYSFGLRYVAIRAAHRLPPAPTLVALVPGSLVAACTTLSIYLTSFPWPQQPPFLSA